VIDIHAHVLPGFDDGVKSLEEALELVRGAAAEGVTVLAATPHVRDDYPTRAEQMERGVAALRHELAQADVGVEIVPAGEVAIERVWQLQPDELLRFTYGGRGHWLLLEFPYRGWPPLLEQTVTALGAAGIATVLAHPERNDAVQREPARLLPLVRSGTLVQLTAASVTGALGKAPRDTSLRLLALGAAQVIATDAHRPHMQGRPGLVEAVAALDDLALGDYLVRLVPQAVLAGDDVPPRPE
jgi:protein-tyrosine phosphatase